MECCGVASKSDYVDLNTYWYREVSTGVSIMFAYHSLIDYFNWTRVMFWSKHNAFEK